MKETVVTEEIHIVEITKILDNLMLVKHLCSNYIFRSCIIIIFALVHLTIKLFKLGPNSYTVEVTKISTRYSGNNKDISKI